MDRFRRWLHGFIVEVLALLFLVDELSALVINTWHESSLRGALSGIALGPWYALTGGVMTFLASMVSGIIGFVIGVFSGDRVAGLLEWIVRRIKGWK